MAVLDLESLLAEVSPDKPAGELLEHDPEYTSLINDAQGTPPVETADGQLVKEGTPPNWREIKSRAIDLLAKTKDMNLAMYLLAATTANDGLPGLAAGLEFIHGLLDRYWDHLEPRFRDEDYDNGIDPDPAQIVNAVIALDAPPGKDGDPYQIQDKVRRAPLCESRQLGRFSYRDILLIKGETGAAADESIPDAALIDGAFTDTDPEVLAEIGAAIESAVKTAAEIDQWMTAKLGSTQAVGMSGFATLLKGIHATVGTHLANRGLGEAPAEEGGAEGDGGGAAQGGAGPAPISGTITGPEDVRKALQKIVDYYAKAEPSSPVPLILKRAMNLVSADYLAIVKDLTPDAAHAIKTITGVDPYEEG